MPINQSINKSIGTTLQGNIILSGNTDSSTTHGITRLIWVILNVSMSIPLNCQQNTITRSGFCQWISRPPGRASRRSRSWPRPSCSRGLFSVPHNPRGPPWSISARSTWRVVSDTLIVTHAGQLWGWETFGWYRAGHYNRSIHRWTMWYRGLVFSEEQTYIWH